MLNDNAADHAKGGGTSWMHLEDWSTWRKKDLSGRREERLLLSNGINTYSIARVLRNHMKLLCGWLADNHCTALTLQVIDTIFFVERCSRQTKSSKVTGVALA